MSLIKISKVLLVLILPFLIFLAVLNFVGFDSSYYRERFSDYNVTGALSIHEKVISFVTGSSNELPQQFNEREKRHLLDVRNAVGISKIILYVLFLLFIFLLLSSAFLLRINNYIANFIGKVLIFGGFLTIVLASLLFFLINSDFSSTFESFHSLFFEKGTYTFDPEKEFIVKLYPEQLFMELGLKISKNAVLASISIILLGAFLIVRSKNTKNKNRHK